jgi:acyl carrier protein
VAQAVAFAAPDPRLGEDVAAAVVLRGGAAATERELREFAANRLAGFKVPRRVLILEEIPKGPTGKLQRIGLAEKLGLRLPDPEPPTRRADELPPRTPLEKELARIWSEVLRVENIGRETNFLALGGDSVLATQVVSRVRDRLDVEVSLLQFFEAPTVASLADSLEKLRRGGGEEPAGDALGAPPA